MSPQTEEDLAYMSRVPYADAVGCLMYAMDYTRSDIAQLLVLWVSSWLDLRIADIGLVYRNDKECLVTGQSDSDYTADMDTRRSVIRYVFTLGGSVVS